MKHSRVAYLNITLTIAKFLYFRFHDLLLVTYEVYITFKFKLNSWRKYNNSSKIRCICIFLIYKDAKVTAVVIKGILRREGHFPQFLSTFMYYLIS